MAEKVRCRATTKAGKRCQAAAMKGSGDGRCLFHTKNQRYVSGHLKGFSAKYNRKRK